MTLDRKSSIWHLMVSLRMLYVMTLNYIFKVINFEMWISRKSIELPRNSQIWLLKRLIFAIEWGPLWMFFSMTFNFQGETFQVAILTSKCWKLQYYYCHQIGSQVFTIEWRHCECCTSWPWPTFSKLRFLKCKNLKTVRAIELFSSMTFIEVDICHRMGPLGMLYSVTLIFIFQGHIFLVMHLL